MNNSILKRADGKENICLVESNDGKIGWVTKIPRFTLRTKVINTIPLLISRSSTYSFADTSYQYEFHYEFNIKPNVTEDVLALCIRYKDLERDLDRNISMRVLPKVRNQVLEKSGYCFPSEKTMNLVWENPLEGTRGESISFIDKNIYATLKIKPRV